MLNIHRNCFAIETTLIVMKISSALSLALAASLAFVSCGNNDDNQFWSASGGKFQRGYKTYDYYIGTNMWYGPLLASDTYAAAPERLETELDSLKSLGITNLRVLVGADGEAGTKSKVEPTLQTGPGVYDEKVFVGLDRFLVELGKRDMSAVLYMNNSWEWSGGYGQYLGWTGDEVIIPADVSWGEYCDYASRFITNEKAKGLFKEHVKNVVTRVNTVTGKPYTEDPAIFSWQICNEPRCFVKTPEVKEAFATWLCETAAYIKSLDPNHMVSTGNEGMFGCELDMDLYRKIHSDPNIDYLTIHIWPYNWQWVKADSLTETLPVALKKTDNYIDQHIRLAEELGKPLVIEEFGFPRDSFAFKKGTPVTARDTYYTHIFSRLEQSARHGGVFAGVNFWTWGGIANQNPEHIYWQKGDDYCGDPAQEQQGLNSVYLSDESTIGLILDFNTRLAKIKPDESGRKSAKALISKLSKLSKEGKVLYGHQDDVFYGHNWKLDAIPENGFIRSDIRETSGQYPAILGMDLGGIEMGDGKNLDGIPFDMMKAAAEQHYAKGGILTFSWHARNPLTGGDAWDISSDRTVDYVINGEGQELFKEWLTRLADFLESIKGLDGKPAVVIFRPWHEHTGSWFWWGQDLCTSKQYKALWERTYDYLTYHRNLTNIVWGYSPSGVTTEEEYMERYPGDRLVDILGADIYEYPGKNEPIEAGNERYQAQLRRTFDVMKKIATGHDKLMALTETGLESLKYSHWWTETLLPIMKEYPIAYVLTWRNAWDKPEHFYAPYPDFADAEDFVRFAEDETILLLDGLNNQK